MTVGKCDDCEYIPLSPRKQALYDIVAVIKSALTNVVIYEYFDRKNLVIYCKGCGKTDDIMEDINLNEAKELIERYKGCE